MKSVDDIIETLRTRKEDFHRRYGVAAIGVFGSYARGEQGPDSDLDLLVDFERPCGLIAFERLASELSRLLDVPVDLVTRKALKPAIGVRVLRELRNV
jgi:hypothetical protein